MNALKVVLPAVLIVMLLSTSFASAPVKPRPLTGIGILLIKDTKPGSNAIMPLYREPMLGRIAGIQIEKLPGLSPFIRARESRRVVVVTAKRLGWYRLIYDDGEREGWAQWRTSADFHKWEELLPGKGAALLPGLKKEYYQLRQGPSNSSEPLELLGRGDALYCIELDGEWLRVMVRGEKTGWLRWRDDNRRLLIAVTL